MQEITLLTELFDRKILAILAVLTNDTSGGLYLREISKYSQVSDASTHRIINKLLELGIVEQEKIKKLKLYKFKKSSKTEFLYKILKKDVQVINIFIEEVKKHMSIDQIILYGEETNKRASILLIGDVIHTEKVKEIVGSIQMKYNFLITPTMLNNETYENLSNMGQFLSKKRILFKR